MQFDTQEDLKKALKPEPVVAKTDNTRVVKNVKTESIDKEAKKELQKAKNRFTQVEEILSRLSARKSELESQLALPEIYGDNNKFRTVESDYQKALKELEAANAEYETLFEKIMKLES